MFNIPVETVAVLVTGAVSLFSGLCTLIAALNKDRAESERRRLELFLSNRNSVYNDFATAYAELKISNTYERKIRLFSCANVVMLNSCEKSSHAVLSLCDCLENNKWNTNEESDRLFIQCIDLLRQESNPFNEILTNHSKRKKRLSHTDNRKN